MLYLIKNSLRCYFNDETKCYEFHTVKGRVRPRKILDDGSCLYSLIPIIKENGRTSNIKFSIVDGICRYIFGMNSEDDYVIDYIDGNYKNLSNDNISIKTIYDYCDNWVSPYQLKNKYKISSSGLVYNCETKNILSFSEDGNYNKILQHSVHRLVWEYFGNESLSENKIVDHIDNNIMNNDISNLQLVSQNINIKKERSILSDKSNITIKKGEKTYYLGKRNYHTYEEAEKIYYTALSYIDDGTIDLYFCNHDYIRYDFLLCKWKIINLPNKKNNEFINDKLFDSYDECEDFFNKKLKELNLKYYPIGSKEYYLERNIIHFKDNRKSYKFRLLKNNKLFSEKVVDLFLSMSHDDFINMMPSLYKERDYLKNTKTTIKEENIKSILKSDILTNNFEQYKEFNTNPNYVYDSLNKHYVFNIPFNGKYYLLGSIQDIDLVNEINDIIIEKKGGDEFLSWLINFKDEFKNYQLMSEKRRYKQLREESKGYYYFKSRNCWKSHITYNGEKICLGYFKDEFAASYMYKEAATMIEYEKFDNWVINLKEHQNRIKLIFNC